MRRALPTSCGLHTGTPSASTNRGTTTCRSRSLISGRAGSSSGSERRSKSGLPDKHPGAERAPSVGSLADVPARCRAPWTSALRGSARSQILLPVCAGPSGPQSIHLRSGDGLDGRRPIGGANPAGGGAGSERAPSRIGEPDCRQSHRWPSTRPPVDAPDDSLVANAVAARPVADTGKRSWARSAVSALSVIRSAAVHRTTGSLGNRKVLAADKEALEPQADDERSSSTSGATRSARTATSLHLQPRPSQEISVVASDARPALPRVGALPQRQRHWHARQPAGRRRWTIWSLDRGSVSRTPAHRGTAPRDAR